MRVRPIAIALAAVVAAAGVCALIAFTAPLGADYPGPTCIGCDYAGPPLAALSHGDVHGFFAKQPVIGIVSLALRAPAAAIGLHAGGVLGAYQAGAFVCLLAAALLALWAAARLVPEDRRSLARWLLPLLTIVNPMTFKALHWGHPEEPLAAMLCVVAVLLAGRGRSIAAGVTLGVAFATKQWALLALGPVLLAAPRGRVRLSAAAGVVAAALTLPMLLGDPGRYVAIARAVGTPGGEITPTNVWWVFASQTAYVSSAIGTHAVYEIPRWIGGFTHKLVIAVGLALPLVYARVTRRRDTGDALLMLALVFLLRTLLDPVSISYHHTAFLIALLAAEAVRRRGLPWASLAAMAFLYGTSEMAALERPDLLNRFYLGWSLPFAAYLGLTLFSPGALAALERRLGRREPAASAA